MRNAFAFMLTCTLAISTHAFADVQRTERGNLVIEDVPAIPDTVTERLNRYLNARIASFRGWLPEDRGILVVTRFGETFQIHRVDTPGGVRTQLTFFDEPVISATPSPNAEVNGFVFSKDVGGSEHYQLFFYDLASGAYEQLTTGAGRNGGVKWSHSGDRFVYFTTRRNGRDWDIHLIDMADRHVSTPVIEREGVWFPVDWAPDDTQLLVKRFVSATEDYLYLLELETGQLTEVNPSDEPVSHGAAVLSTGTDVYFTSDQNSEYKHLRHVDLRTGKQRILTSHIPWDIEELDLSADGRLLAFVANEDGIGKLRVLEVATGNELDVPDIPIGQIYRIGFDPEGSRIGMVVNTPRTPGDTYTLNLESGDLVRWTFSEVGGLNTDEFVMPELIRYDTFDSVDGTNRTIPAFVYKPDAEGPHPVLIDIHGGPEAQAIPYFSTMTAYYTNELGIAVIRPNVRGSSGYGKSFLALDDGYKREDAVRDIGALLDWIETQSDLDENRIAVTGGSYGGYMSLASLTHYNDRLRAGISVVGITNFVTFLENTMDYRRDLRRAEYGDERDPEMREFLLRISPVTNADRISVPVLIGQGLNDPRVPAGEAEQIVDAIRANGGDVWYVLAKDEGHGFQKKGNRDYWNTVTATFLMRYLLPE